MTNTDTIRDMQDLIDRAKAVGMLGWRKAQIALAALSTIDPEAISRTDSSDLVIDIRNELTLDDSIMAMQAHDDAIRRECAENGKKKFRDMVKSPNQRDIPAFKTFRDNQADELYAAILSEEGIDKTE